jgi:hypothetical protein
VKATVTVRWNADDTITVRIDRHVEHFDVAMKTKAELFEAIRWAIISKGVSLDEADLTEILYEELQRRL